MKINKILNLFPYQRAFAHCDIPCGIYDPHTAQMAAHTMIRMTEFLDKVDATEGIVKAGHDVVRVTSVKERHSDLLEHELTTLKNDYFKDEHYEKFPELEKLFTEANKAGAKVRQGIEPELAVELLETVMKIAEIFYATKDVKSARVKSVYPTGLDIIVPAA